MFGIVAFVCLFALLKACESSTGSCVSIPVQKRLCFMNLLATCSAPNLPKCIVHFNPVCPDKKEGAAWDCIFPLWMGWDGRARFCRITSKYCSFSSTQWGGVQAGKQKLGKLQGFSGLLIKGLNLHRTITEKTPSLVIKQSLLRCPHFGKLFSSVYLRWTCTRPMTQQFHSCMYTPNRHVHLVPESYVLDCA